MKKYELAVMLHPDLEIDLEAPLARLDELLSSIDAKVTKRDEWGKRRLAYKIAGQDFAVYVFYRLEADPSKMADLERGLRLNEEVLRYLVVVLDEKAEEVENEEGEEAEKKAAKSESDSKGEEKK